MVTFSLENVVCEVPLSSNEKALLFSLIYHIVDRWSMVDSRLTHGSRTHTGVRYPVCMVAGR
jgi:hypothetical protein